MLGIHCLVLCFLRLFLQTEVQIAFHVAQHHNHLYHKGQLLSKTHVVNGHQYIAYLGREEEG